MPSLLTEAQIAGQYTTESNAVAAYSLKTTTGVTTPQSEAIIHYTDSVLARFPLRPILDSIIIREIPLAEFIAKIGGVDVPIDDARFKRGSDRGEIVAIARNVTDELSIGDLVIVNEYGKRAIYLNPADEFSPDAPKYFKVRVADIDSVVERR